MNRQQRRKQQLELKRQIRQRERTIARAAKQFRNSFGSEYINEKQALEFMGSLFDAKH